MNAFKPLFWMGAVYLLVRIINGGSPTFWLWLGVVTKSLINIFRDAEPESDELAKSVWLLVSLLRLVLE